MTHVVAFRGLDERSGPLAWGQRWSWDILQELIPNEDRLNLWLRVWIEDGQSVDDVIAVLTAMVAAHQTLRTTYRLNAEGEPEQVVHGAGEIGVALRPADPDAVLEATDRLRDELMRGRFDLERDLPIRLGIVVSGSAAVSLVMVMSNLVLDGWGIEAFRAEVRQRLAALATGTATPPELDRALQPLDQAARERTQPWRDIDDASNGYWRAQLAAIEERCGRQRRLAGEIPRFWYGEISSVAMSRAVNAIAQRLRVAPSAVLLAGLAVIFGLHTGQDGCGMFVVSSNRHRPAMRTALGRYVQSSPMLLDLQHDTFDDLVRAAAGGLLRASRFGQADPARLSGLVHGQPLHGQHVPGQGVRRGAHLALPIVFDYHHQPHRQARPSRASVDVDLATLRASAVQSTFSWLHTAEKENMHLYIQVHRPSRIGFWIDTRFLSRVDLLCIVFGAERLLIEAVAGCVALKDLSAVTGVSGVAGGSSG